MNINNVDLNIFKQLVLILRHKSLTIAANKAGVTQPAMSHALKKAREIYDDPLLIKRGSEAYLSPKGEMLKYSLHQLISDIQEKILDIEPFDPKTSSRSFTLLASSQFHLVHMSEILGFLEKEAPGIALKTRPFNGDTIEASLAASEAQLAFGVSRQDYTFLMQKKLFREGFLSATCQRHPLANRNKVDLTGYLQYSHILVNLRGEGKGIVDDLLDKKGKKRFIKLQTSDFLNAGFLLPGSHHILTAPASFLLAARKPLNLKTFEPPLKIPQFDFKCFWHEKDSKDEAVCWLRNSIIEIILQKKSLLFGED